MRIKDGLKIRDIVGERVVIMQGKAGADMTRLISLNASAEWLWNDLQGREFSADDVAGALVARYGIDAERAAADAGAWIDKLVNCGAIEL